MTDVRARIVVSGRVQGVMFRESMRRQAEAHGVSGWVRNLPDGRVEAILEGDEPDVDALIEWSRRGPSRARVDATEVAWEEHTGEFEGFDVLFGWSW